ncbi:hypothetical protein [Sediminicurvatus halobius]|uniref:Uncharacterized protein n=1 Tax=Sediminicurvatus halobius TaxID=2182432 RepID=A0A2U2N352_9GAMM|nr:hypothetical protein [Spiribacter halobius]PWG63487.1 hypothetical protein DEM34_07940 [Spiribacter halobius]UEX79643.1 hypothetical protein LMH63_08345 [Spiribacter halobius]
MTWRIPVALALMLMGSHAGAHIDTNPGERDLAEYLAKALAAQPAVASCEMPEAAERTHDGLPASGTPWESLLARPAKTEAPGDKGEAELC